MFRTLFALRSFIRNSLGKLTQREGCYGKDFNVRKSITHSYFYELLVVLTTLHTPHGTQPQGGELKPVLRHSHDLGAEGVCPIGHNLGDSVDVLKRLRVCTFWVERIRQVHTQLICDPKDETSQRGAVRLVSAEAAVLRRIQFIQRRCAAGPLGADIGSTGDYHTDLFPQGLKFTAVKGMVGGVVVEGDVENERDTFNVLELLKHPDGVSLRLPVLRGVINL